MVTRYFIFIVLFCLGANYAQPLKFQVKGINSSIAWLSSLSGETTNPVDSLSSKDKETFEYSFSGKNPHFGFYQLRFENNKILQFIYDGKPVFIKTTASAITDSIVVLASEGNKLYFDFLTRTKAYKTNSELLHLLLLRYPPDSKFYESAKTELETAQNEYREFVFHTAQENPKSFAARYIRSASLYESGVTSKEAELLDLKQHALDSVNFNDAGLIYSDLFTTKTIEYLTYYRNTNLPKDLLEKEFMKGIDSILNRAKVNLFVYRHIVEYLLEGFRKFGFENVVDYVISTYVVKDDLCLSENTSSTLSLRIDQTKKLPVGAVAPIFHSSDSNGKPFVLPKSHRGNTLLIFYASWCPHCKSLFPQLIQLQKNGSFNVVAVSLDTSRKDWETFVASNNIKGENLCDLKGWDGEASHLYYIYATPTMFLLDAKNTILAKPTTYAELVEALEKIK